MSLRLKALLERCLATTIVMSAGLLFASPYLFIVIGALVV